MAVKQSEFKVAITGDTSDLEKRLDKLGDSVASTTKEIEDIGKTSVKTSKGFDGVRDSADNSERRITGFRDSLTGTQDVMKGLREGDMVALSTGFADLASSVANLGADLLDWGKKALEGAKNVVAAHGASVVAKGKDIAATVAHKVASVASTVATSAQTAAQWALNAAMSANPIVLVVLGLAALVAIFVVAWKNSETFRDIVTGAFDAVKAAAEFAFNWVKDNWPLLLAILTGPIGLAVLAIVKNWDTIKAGASAVVEAVVGFFTGLPGRISAATVGMWDGITDAFKAAINTIIRTWNKLSFTIGGGSYDPLGKYGPTVSVPSFTFNTPDIPTLHTGGMFRAPTPGGQGLALLRDGERVSTPGGAGMPAVNVYGNVYGFDDFERKVAEAQRSFARRG